MPNEKNKQLVKNIKEKLEKAKSITFTNYIGISSDQANQLRQKVKEAGGEVFVGKNTLMKVAIEESGDSNLKKTEKDLKGPTMAVFGFSDSIAPIKALLDFIKNVELPKIKSAIIDGVYNSAERVEEIKDIPSKEILYTKIVTSLNSPISGFVNVINGVQKKFVFAISAIAKKISEGGAN